jgi:hypothetical protein
MALIEILLIAEVEKTGRFVAIPVDTWHAQSNKWWHLADSSAGPIAGRRTRVARCQIKVEPIFLSHDVARLLASLDGFGPKLSQNSL